MAHEPSGKMTKTEQALVLDPPSELHFKGPFSEVTTSYLKLTNPTDKQIGFKVKTTAPKTYCVRPNGGVIVPKKTVSVAVMLQPFDPENDDRSRDKFMVQSMFVPDGENYQDSLWHDIPPEGLMNSKLKCVFDVPAASSEATEVKAEVIEQPKPKAKVVHVQDLKPSDIETAESKKLHEEYKRLKSELNDVRAENSSLKTEKADSHCNCSEVGEESEKILFEEGLALGEKYLKFLEQQSCITGQEIMTVYTMQKKLQLQHPKDLKQVTIQQMFAKLKK